MRGEGTSRGSRSPGRLIGPGIVDFGLGWGPSPHNPPRLKNQKISVPIILTRGGRSPVSGFPFFGFHPGHGSQAWAPGQGNGAR